MLAKTGMICWEMNLTRQLEIKEAEEGAGGRGPVLEIMMIRKLKMMKQVLSYLPKNSCALELIYVKLIVNLLQSTPSFDFFFLI